LIALGCFGRPVTSSRPIAHCGLPKPSSLAPSGQKKSHGLGPFIPFEEKRQQRKGEREKEEEKRRKGKGKEQEESDLEMELASFHQNLAWSSVCCTAFSGHEEPGQQHQSRMLLGCKD